METEEAVEKAIDFMERRGRQPIHRLLSIRLVGDVWKVKFDTGIFTKNVIELEVDDKTGRVMKYEESG